MADAVLLLPPYYFASVPDQGIEDFILAVLQKSKLPCYLYNYSVHTGNLVSVESYKKLAEQLPHLRGIKCTVTAMSDATPYKEAIPELQVSHSCFSWNAALNTCEFFFCCNVQLFLGTASRMPI